MKQFKKNKGRGRATSQASLCVTHYFSDLQTEFFLQKSFQKYLVNFALIFKLLSVTVLYTQMYFHI